MKRIFKEILRRDFRLCLLLAIVLVLPYWSIHSHDFINLDDNHYLTENPIVRKGITWRGITWAFSINDIDYWRPMAWLSHMLDFEIYGMNPKGHHLNNLILHIINTLLLFILLRRMTHAFWRSAAAALLFGLHPLNVESVAWVAERKNVLSAFFYMTTLLAYVRYSEKPRLSRYVLALVSFGLGLMAKPAIATLPFILLLLDRWPLCRLRFETDATNTAKPEGSPFLSKLKSVPFTPFLVEKIPFLALSATGIYLSSSSAALHNRMVATETIPMLLRAQNAIVSYVTYIEKTLWPKDLAVFYPFPQSVTFSKVFAACVLLIAVTSLALWKAKTHPYLLLGWFWYIFTLFPAIGLVQVGIWPAMADRFAYIPLVGALIMIVWGLHHLFLKLPLHHVVRVFSLASVILLLMLLTARQVSYWQNSERLFVHALKVTRNNHLAYNNLGSFYAAKRDFRKALPYLKEAVRIMPENPLFLNNLGTALAHTGRYQEALDRFSKALALAPEYAEVYVNMGYVMSKQGRREEARTYFRKSLEIRPLPEAYHNLGLDATARKDLQEAVLHYKKALQLRPDDPRVHNDLGVALAQQGKTREAITHFKEALRLDPNYVQPRHNLRVLQGNINKAGKTRGSP